MKIHIYLCESVHARLTTRYDASLTKWKLVGLIPEAGLLVLIIVPAR